MQNMIAGVGKRAGLDWLDRPKAREKEWAVEVLEKMGAAEFSFSYCQADDLVI